MAGAGGAPGLAQPVFAAKHLPQHGGAVREHGFPPDVHPAVRRLLYYFRVEQAALRVDELDGISGPCSGCASDVFTGYTQGIMGQPLAYKGGETLFDLEELAGILYSVTSQVTSGATSDDVVCALAEAHRSLPGIDDLSEALCGGTGLVEVSRGLLESLRSYVARRCDARGCASRVAESLLVTALVHNEVFTPGGLPCPATVLGELLLLGGSGARRVPVLRMRVERVAGTTRAF